MIPYPHIDPVVFSVGPLAVRWYGVMFLVAFCGGLVAWAPARCSSGLDGVGLFSVRVANFINGELWGKPTLLPWGIIYEGVPRHPSQLYEATLEGVVLA